VQHVGRYQRKQITLSEGPSAHALADVPQIRQVLLNLLAAALDRVRDGGYVRLEVQPREDGAEVLLADDGAPYSPREQAAIFDPAAPETAESSQRSGLGDGLGLSVSACVVRDHGGDIQVGGQGQARFRVVLPSAKVEQSLVVEQNLAA
jgi:signal transduction histidine kinase